MNTKIKVTYKDTPYILEYNRAAIKEMEASGFTFDGFKERPMTNIDIAFSGLFFKNHRNTKESTIREIYSLLSNKSGLIETMTTMIAESYESLFDDNSSDEGNIAWEIVGTKPTK